MITVRTLESRLLDRFAGRIGFLALALAYAMLALAYLAKLTGEGELTLGS